MNSNLPITETDLHAFVDGQLTPERQHEIAAYLASRPDEAQRVDSYRVQKRELRALFDPVLDEPVPARLLRAARPRTPWYLQRLAAGVVIAIASGTAGWGLRGGMPGESGQLAQSTSGTSGISGTSSTPGPSSTSGTTTHITTVSSMSSATGFAQRAAVAHAVYSPEQRRAVEVDAAHEDQLVAWLSKRMGTPMKPPHLQALSYALEGGRLLPGDKGPVAQFMYRKVQDEGTGGGTQGRLTLYVSSEIGDLANPSSTGDPGKAATGASGGKNTRTAFSFAQQGKVNVFYWVDGPFGYAISADAEPAELARVSSEVYRQLDAAR